MPVRARVFATLLLTTAVACGEDEPGTAPAPVDPGSGPRTNGAPAPWQGLQGARGQFAFGTDAGVKYEGAHSAFIRSQVRVPDSTQQAVLVQELSAARYRGQRLRWAAQVRADSVTGRGAGLWLRVDGPHGTLFLAGEIDSVRAMRGTRDWTEHVVVLDVPDAAVGLAFGAILSGGGFLRVDAGRLEVVPQSVPTTDAVWPGGIVSDSTSTVNHFDRLAREPRNVDFEGLPEDSDAAWQWVAATAIPFATDDPTASLADLAPFGAMVGSARIVGAGEATHGTREFFRMKHRLFRYLAETQGFTHFAIEATLPESRMIDHYVATGEGEPARLLAGQYFWTWNTQEVLDLIRWMREYNARAGAPRLRFVGFDMQYPEYAMDSVVAFAVRQDRGEGVAMAQRYQCLNVLRPQSARGTISATGFAQLGPARQAECADSLEAAHARLVARRADWRTPAEADAYDWALRYSEVARQWMRRAREPNAAKASALRDVAMAENLAWFAEREPSARLFAWAHNGHVSRRSGSMGQALDRRFGDAYRVVGLTFGRGRFNALLMRSNIVTGPLITHESDPPPTGAVEGVFERTPADRLILDARRLRDAPAVVQRLRGPIQMRSVG